MEYTATPAAPRRLVRRLIPWTLAMGLFAGGGYGVYSYAVPRMEGTAKTSSVEPADSATTAVSPSANAQIKQLFSSPPADSTPYANRYAAAPQLPPATEEDEVATPRSAVSVTGGQNPFTTTPVGSFGEPYSPPRSVQSPAVESAEPAGAGAAPATTTAQETAAEVDALDAGPLTNAAAAENGAEIARGQEPVGGNPLRSGGSRPPQPSGPAGAQEAFGEQAAIAQPKAIDLGPAARKTGPGDSTSSTDIVIPSSGASPAAGGPARYGAGPGQATDAQSAAAAFSEAANGAGELKAAAPTAAEPTLADPPTSPWAGVASTQPLRQPAASFAAQQSTGAASLAAADAGVTPTPGLAAADGAGRPGERILEGLQNSSITIQKLAPAEIQVGKKCTFAVRVLNNSQRTAHNVQVRDEVPLGTQLVGAAPKASVSGSQVLWDLGTLSPGEERIVEMELMPTDEGELGSVATVTFAAQASAKVRCTKPELALRLSAGPRVMIGQQHLVEIEVTNPGSGNATGVMLLESVPTGVSHEAGPALEFEVGTLKPGESRRLDLVLTAEQAGRINNVMTARADASLEVQAACEFEVIAPALKLSVEGPGRRYLERPATYTVSVDNPGTASAKEVQLITQLPKGLQFVSANNMGEYDAATHSIHWSLAELPANERGTVELTALPVEPGEHTLQVASRAEQGLEDRTEARVTVEGLVALSFEVEAADGAIEVGGETSYQITVVNQGSKPAANVQVIAAIPQGLRATNGGGASRHVVQGDRVVFAPLAQLAPKAEAKFQVKVQGLTAGDRRTKIMVTADEVPEPITKEQSTRVYADQ